MNGKTSQRSHWNTAYRTSSQPSHWQLRSLSNADKNVRTPKNAAEKKSIDVTSRNAIENKTKTAGDVFCNSRVKVTKQQVLDASWPNSKHDCGRKRGFWRSDREEWLNWCRGWLDRYDPLQRKAAEVFQHLANTTSYTSIEEFAWREGLSGTA